MLARGETVYPQKRTLGSDTNGGTGSGTGSGTDSGTDSGADG
jgi:hypothetical protein